MRTDAAFRVAISSLAVLGGTGAFIAVTTGHRTTAIGLALTAGVFGVAAAFGGALEREVLQEPREAPPVVVPTAMGVAGYRGLRGR